MAMHVTLYLNCCTHVHWPPPATTDDWCWSWSKSRGPYFSALHPLPAATAAPPRWRSSMCTEKRNNDDEKIDPNKPHPETLCQKCKELGFRCTALDRDRRRR